jgi:hypothetical protein
MILNLLREKSAFDSAQEETIHPWRPNHVQTFDLPFFRVWNNRSGSRPDKSDRMLSRAPRKRLDSFETRKTSLAAHLNYKDWTASAYISFKTASRAL